MVTANDHQLGLLNGTHATVTAVDPRRRTLTLTAEDDQNVVVGADWAARHLDHGYATTCHKAQGATVDVALLYGTAALTREAGYVALSRGRTANHLYVPDDTCEPAAVAGDGYLDELAVRLSRRRTQTLATRQLPRSQPGRWQTSRHVQPDQHRAEGITR
jgi:ATP-dependent exoDNAse (exonuclease V) alpha subunit